MSDKLQKEERFLICIAGPTGVGKTALSILLAQHYGTEIISCDSRQLYKEMDIGTAKTTPEELSKVVHHMVSTLSIEDTFSTGHYERMVIPLVNKLHQSYQSLILSGGTGLYFKAVLEGLDNFPEVKKKIKEELNLLHQNEGLDILQSRLKELDPVYYDIVDRGNPHRLLRALGVILSSGKSFSSFLAKNKSKRPFTPILIFLNRDREELYKRINQRVIKMMEKGLLNEVKVLHRFRHLSSLQTVGYQELFRYLDGELSLKDAISLIQRNSRRYAKRQITWFRNQGPWKEFHPDSYEEITGYIDSYLRR